jgi:iron complex outermembrane recepter protein
MNPRRNRPWGSPLFAAVLGLGLASSATQAYAQQAAPGTSAGDPGEAQHGAAASPDDEVLQQVVVTAQRRTENAMTTPIAVSSLSEADIEKKGVRSIIDLQYATPSLSVQEVGQTSSFNIRGIGQQSTDLNAVPGVPLYIDGLLNPTIITTSAFFDVGNIEVLRGPQGTFAGASSTGGAIFVTSRNPDFSGLHGEFGAQVGNYQDLGAHGAVNMPLSEHVAARIAFNVERRNSFFTNIGAMPGPGKTLYNSPGALDEKELRASLLWTPDDDLSVLWKTLLIEKSTGGYPYIPLPNPGYAPYISQAYPDPSRILNYDTIEKNDEHAARSTLEVKWRLPGDLTLRSLSGYGFYRTINVHDIDATALDLPAAGLPHVEELADTPETTVSQELNLLSPEEGRLQWVLGAFYFHDNIGQVSKAIQTGSGDNFNNVAIAKRSMAGFGQVSFALTPALQLQVGGRFTKDKADTSGYNVTVGSDPSPRSGHYEGNNTTGKIALNYKANANNFLYAFVAKGANAGGTANGVPFSPAIVKDYEAGWKATFLDGHARTQLGVFHNDLTNFQADALTPVNGTVTPTNIPKTKIDGVEAQLEAKLGRLTLDFAGNYIRSRMGDFDILNLHTFANSFVPLPQCPAGTPTTANVCNDYGAALLSLSNAPLPYSPKWTYDIGVEYTFFLGKDSTLAPRVNYSYQAFQWAAPTEQYPLDYLAAHGLLGAQLSYQHGAYGVVAYGTNLLDKTYVSGQSPPAYFLGAPRQFGVRFSVDF